MVVTYFFCLNVIRLCKKNTGKVLDNSVKHLFMQIFSSQLKKQSSCWEWRQSFMAMV